MTEDGPVKESLEAECARYLQTKAGARRIMAGLRQRYTALGHPGGSLLVAQATAEECLFLRGILKKDFPPGEDISVSINGFMSSFQGTRFAGVQLAPLLAAYFGEPIQTNKERASRHFARRQAFFAQLIVDSGQLAVRAWLENALAHPLSGDYQWLEGSYQADSAALARRICQLDRLVEFLDSTAESLARPVVAAQVTKDPHSLDDGAPLLKALLYYLRYFHDYPALETTAQRQQLLSLANIDTDTASNNLPTYGIFGQGEQGETLGWESFYQRREPLVLTGANLVTVRQLALAEGATVYCFENPAVFHTFLRRLPRQACCCGGGQLNRATLWLLELLQRSGVNVWYHGDFDPEGLLIADRLRQQFANVHLFAYEAELYEKAVSGAEISPRRLKQLDKLRDPALIAVGERLRQTKKAGYQEYIIEDLLAFAQV